MGGRLHEDEMTTAGLVDALRGDELASLTADVEAGRRDHVLKSLDERGAAQELIRQQYSGRYPFELLQNANDAAADAGREGRVRFVLTDSALLVADNGTGFGPEQVRAICGLARSSKDPRKSVGYKGLGFKSVGEVTNRPQISSSGVAFEFDEHRVREAVSLIAGDLTTRQRLPVYAFPFFLDADRTDDGGLVARLHQDGFTTVLRLPFRPGVDREHVAAHLVDNLVPRLLLFLGSMAELELAGSEGDFVASVARSDLEECQEVLLQHDDEIEHWLVFRDEIAVDPEVVAPLGDAWSVVEAVHVAVAVPLDAAGRPDASTSHPLHVYFPTEERTGFPFVVQGDFALQLDRRQVASSPETDPYNRMLLDRAAGLIGRVAEALALRFPGQGCVASVMAQRSSPTGHGETFTELAVEALRRARYLPGCDGEPRMPVEALLLPAAVEDPGRLHRHLHLRDVGRLLHPDVERDAKARSFLVERMEVQEWELEDAAAQLHPPPIEEVTDFYEALLDWSEALRGHRLAPALAAVPFVRTAEGRWAAPGNERVFFPRRRDDVDVPEDMPVPIAAVPDLPGLDGLLKECGVRDFEWRELLTSHLLPLLTDGDTAPAQRDRAINGLRAYFSSQRSGDPRLRRQIADVLVPARRAGGGTPELRPAGRTYFGATWTGSEKLEAIYGPFGEAEFLAIDPPSDDQAKQTERDFFAWVGVADHPRVLDAEVDQKDVHLTENLARHPHRRLAGWDEWWTSPEVAEARSCGQGHPSSQQVRRSYALDRFADLVRCEDAGRLLDLWSELAARWSTVYGRATDAAFYCQHAWHGGERERRTPSLLMHQLTTLPWIPTTKAQERLLVPPPEAWRRSFDTPKWVLRRIALVDDRLTEGPGSVLAVQLGIADAARPAPSDLAVLLAELAEEFETASGPTKEIQTAARWAMRTLNDSLTDEHGLEEVPLLARFQGKPVFVSDPVVAADPLLAQAWEDHYPILDADKDLYRLHSALGLASLDEGVTVLPRPSVVRDELQQVIERQLLEAGPFLAAVAVDAAPSQEDNVIRRLKRLDVVVCAELVLRYAFNEVTIDRSDATSYIAIRQEQDRGFITRQFGTAHLEVDPISGEPDWYGFGPQLAQYIGVQTVGDALAMLLVGTDGDRRKILAARHIEPGIVESMRSRLDLPVDDLEEAELLDDVLAGDSSSTSTEVDDEEPSGPDSDAADGSRVGGAGPTDEDGEPDPPLPDLDPEQIQIEDADAGPVAPASKRRSRGTNLGPSGPVDHDRADKRSRDIGRRGEQAAFEAERKRVADFGGDPSAVVWRADRNPFSPYDIESLDASGVRIYIEVKSTTGDDPTAPFLISQSELVEALRRRESYFIYRVTDVESAAPRVTRYCDPAGLLIDGRARLSVADARMTIGDAEVED